MTLEHLRVDAVRCLKDVVMDLHPERNYIYGPNGAGKTSCLEAIYLLARGRSFRTRETRRLLRHGAEALSVFGRTGPAGSGHRLGVEFKRGRLSAQIDGEPAESQAEMLRLLPVHVIDPRLHRLVEAGPSERRRYLDAGVFHVEHQFLQWWRRYRRVLGQRNAALKRQVSSAELASWEPAFLEAAEAVDAARRAYCEALSEIVTELGETLLGDEIGLKYRPGWRKGSTLAEALAEHRERDRSIGYTQVGPHRADLKLEFQSTGVRDTASRGQQKLVAAALVIAQVRLFESRTGIGGIVLVDDASAELDFGAQGRLRGALDALRSQQILTGLSLDALRPDPGLPVFHVERGEVHPVV